jgi:hypothetical protein
MNIFKYTYEPKFLKLFLFNNCVIAIDIKYNTMYNVCIVNTLKDKYENNSSK